VLLALLWWHNLKIRDLALTHAKRMCKRESLQLLDQSVSFKSIKPVLYPKTLIAIERTYRFEFSSTGDERYIGTIKLRGQYLLGFDLPPYRVPDEEDSQVLH